MSDYIDREQAIESLKARFNDDGKTEYGAFWHHKAVIETLENLPSADVRKNVKGQWNDVACYNVRCSVCGGVMSAPFPYCPWCGSEMVNHG